MKEEAWEGHKAGQEENGSGVTAFTKNSLVLDRKEQGAVNRSDKGFSLAMDFRARSPIFCERWYGRGRGGTYIDHLHGDTSHARAWYQNVAAVQGFAIRAESSAVWRGSSRNASAGHERTGKHLLEYRVKQRDQAMADDRLTGQLDQ
ncbi:hypothetical protein EG328_010308 [Venturia inaequalis]|uniref:Uncharacterized protein n=1 Tax=Venturia inaequalis TaxID=5025 RepID=A0A8H3V6P5_VENIN|nr:hypothetical protein EG328_010308 [Venturia inaequalis]